MTATAPRPTSPEKPTRASSAPGRSGTPTPTRRTQGRTPRAFYWMVVPAVVIFFGLHTIPVVTGMFFSLTNYAGYGTWSFVGLSNYLNLFRDDRVISSYLFTFGFAIVSTIAVNVISLAIALGLNARIKFRTAFRGVFFIPYVLAILIIGYVFNYLFANSFPAIFTSLGLPGLANNILADPDWAWLGIVITTVWQACAFNVILYLAGLQTIPAELYEAAGIDGASSWRQFRSITFPLIGAYFTINMVLSFKSFLQVFDQIVALTNGGPGTSTESIALVIFRGGFQGGEYGYQMANAVLYLFVIILVSFIQLRFLQRREASF
ncbi:carbohydrate ABC transporter permease [Frigoribacterium faeni]|uniref:Raffinose/stachyose/melibiose transport system permease protein n=1 Tax=Frigoribacterium faeni TaxID=145483 RepID=A0A7W3JJV5_9MICO|nr:sugar ABC transporter permease [Frigoribacterium faeni]MBA8814209.1 raffinose/stachyose/melibiose transport system permease protein [Frigoribacterium faeni]BFF16274.1 sugar ABC transporter permease [Microbacterium flavescens]GEK83697.1 sugar ABC transporter permease [Frigoribacterium faeni]